MSTGKGSRLSAQLKRVLGGINDTVEFGLNVGLGLVVSTIFSILITGSLVLPLDNHEDFAMLKEKLGAVPETNGLNGGADISQIQESLAADAEYAGTSLASEPLGESDAITLGENSDGGDGAPHIAGQPAEERPEEGELFRALVSCLADARVLGMWRPLRDVEFWLLLAILATLVRLLHSFFLLSRMRGYDTLLRKSRFEVGARLFQLITQGVILAIGVVIITVWKEGAAWLPLSIGGLAVTFIVALWDAPYYFATKNVQPTEAEERRVKGAFSKWITIDFIGFVMLFLASIVWMARTIVVDTRAVAAQNVVGGVCAATLILVWFVDYVWNGEFYFANGRSVPKEAGVREPGVDGLRGP